MFGSRNIGHSNLMLAVAFTLVLVFVNVCGKCMYIVHHAGVSLIALYTAWSFLNIAMSSCFRANLITLRYKLLWIPIKCMEYEYRGISRVATIHFSDWSGQYRFMIHTNLRNIDNDMGGWFHVLEARSKPGQDDCNGPRSVIARPLIRYSKAQEKAFLITYSNGMVINIWFASNWTW